MTDVPEHLLRRSVERRAALSGQEAPAPVAPVGGASPAATASADVAPAAAAAAPAVPAGPAFVEPVDRAAFARVDAVRRRRIPAWAMGVLAVLPLWGVLYVGAFGERPTRDEEAAVDGAALYGTYCAACHGATGGGGVGPKLSDGEAVKTFPDEAAHVEWVKGGSASVGRGKPYGDPNREGGGRTAATGGMPAFGGSMSEEEIAAVVAYERESL